MSCSCKLEVLFWLQTLMLSERSRNITKQSVDCSMLANKEIHSKLWYDIQVPEKMFNAGSNWKLQRRCKEPDKGCRYLTDSELCSRAVYVHWPRVAYVLGTEDLNLFKSICAQDWRAWPTAFASLRSISSAQLEFDIAMSSLVQRCFEILTLQGVQSSQLAGTPNLDKVMFFSFKLLNSYLLCHGKFMVAWYWTFCTLKV